MIYLGIDIGGTAVKLGLVDDTGRVQKKAESAVNHDQYRTPILQTVLRETAAFLRACGQTPAGIGISAAGQVDVRSGVVVDTCGNLPGWGGSRLTETIGGTFGLPAAAMNDANCALLGEQWVGGAQGRRNAVMITIGTGVGGGILAGGHILTGRDGLAGELGHLPLHAGGKPCTCGNRGCYEQYASVTALLEKTSDWAEPPKSGKALFARAGQGDAQALDALSAWRDDIAAGLIGLVHLFNPELLLIGGGVSAQQALLIDPLRQQVLAGVMPRFGEGLSLSAATLGNDAGMIGAVRHFINSMREEEKP